MTDDEARRKALTVIQEERDAGFPLPVDKPEDFTCFTCGARGTCEYAWDGYNTGGDCLAEK